MYYVYILKYFDNSYYAGLTRNIRSRIYKHKKGLSFSTSYKLSIKLKWVGIFPNKYKAAKFEKYLNQVQEMHFLQNI